MYRCFLYIAIALSIPTNIASAYIWDLANDFSATNNPNGIWQYGGTSNQNYPGPGGDFSLYRFPGERGSNFDFWYGGDTANVDPNVFHNGTLAPQNALGYTLQPNQAAMSVFSGTSIYRWIAPTTGGFSIDVDFIAMNTEPFEVGVFVNKAPLFNARLDTQEQMAAFEAQVFMSSGDTLDFVGKSATNRGVLGVDATIIAVPEPTPSLLVGFSCVAWTLYRTRCRKLSKL